MQLIIVVAIMSGFIDPSYRNVKARQPGQTISKFRAGRTKSLSFLGETAGQDSRGGAEVLVPFDLFRSARGSNIRFKQTFKTGILFARFSLMPHRTAESCLISRVLASIARFACMYCVDAPRFLGMTSITKLTGWSRF